MVNVSKQTHKSMNRMITLVIQYLLRVLPMGKIWHISGKFDQHLSLLLWFRKTKIQDRTGILVVVRVL